MSIIWLNNKLYPNKQTCDFSTRFPITNNYCVVSIKKELQFDSEIKNIILRFACDTSCYIYINNQLVSNSNNKSYGDFNNHNKPALNIYWNSIKTNKFSGKTHLNFLIYVQMGPTKLYDFSTGNGGFIGELIVDLKDGKQVFFETDESWQIRLEDSFNKPCSYVEKEEKKYTNSEVKNYKWNLTKTNILPTVEEEVEFNNEFVFPKGDKKTYAIDFPNIYSSFVELEISGNLEGEITLYENKNETGRLSFLVLSGNKKIRYFDLLSIGGFVISAKNKGESDSKILIHIYHSHYPFNNVGKILTGRKRLDDLFTKCQFASINCSQNMFLDSPKHLEPLSSCAGDYQIISLVFGFSTGNYELAKHVLRGIAKTLEHNKGLIANSSYALVFVNWLLEIYQITGDKELIIDCMSGVISTLKLYQSFVDKNGIIDHPYTYVFLDWLMVDGFNLFCPPMALGQTVLNIYYYQALKSASFFYKELNDSKKSNKYLAMSKKLKKAINLYLFDEKRGLYFEGQSTPTPENYVDKFPDKPIPKNPNKIYFRKHANVLAVAYGLTTIKKSKSIMHKVFGELKDLEIQPYFMFYSFKALRYAKLENKYTMTLIKEWLEHVKIKDKGLPEGFFKPTPDYVFDFSHAWACSPYYSFILAASGLEIVEPGMKKIRLSLKKLRIKNLAYEIGTPFGFIKIKNDKIISIPKEITVINDYYFQKK